MLSQERECPKKNCQLVLLCSKLMDFPSTGDCETVELLLAKGAHVDLEAFCGTPLHCAATAGNVGTMKILLEHNADVSL
jgi:ankyrin repeat protein